MAINEQAFEVLLAQAKESYHIDPHAYEKYNVKRGLRNENGSGVLVGLTNVGEVHGYVMDEGEKCSVEGKLSYRGVSVADIVHAAQKEQRPAFEETAYLLLFGDLPTKEELEQFCIALSSQRELPPGFTEDMILKAPSNDIMNKLARSVLASYSYDSKPDKTSLDNMLRQSIELIARFPVMTAYAYNAKIHYYENDSLYIHTPQPNHSTAETVLHLIRKDNQFTRSEADILDLLLVLHAEHGGGNNSAFTTRVVSSSGTDTYSAIAAAIGSLKGPKHGGANEKVMRMMQYLEENLKDRTNEAEVRDMLTKILKKKAFDRTGLVYGMGHAVYTLSDPRAVLLKEQAAKLAKEKGMEEEFEFYSMIERLTPELFCEIKKVDRPLCANIDLYSGLVYQMLGIPQCLYTPLFATSRIAGWCAHRLEEVITGGKIIRPAYKSVTKRRPYIALDDRKNPDEK